MNNNNVNWKYILQILTLHSVRNVTDGHICVTKDECALVWDLIKTFRNATLTVTVTVTVTVRGARRLWRHRIVCIWNAPNQWPNRKCQHLTVNAADNRMRFTFSGYSKFHKIFRENDIVLLLPIYNRVHKIIFVHIRDISKRYTYSYSYS